MDLGNTVGWENSHSLNSSLANERNQPATSSSLTRGKEPRKVSLCVRWHHKDFDLGARVLEQAGDKVRHRMVLGVHVQRGQFGAVVDEQRDDQIHVLLLVVPPKQGTNLVGLRVGKHGLHNSTPLLCIVTSSLILSFGSRLAAVDWNLARKAEAVGRAKHKRFECGVGRIAPVRGRSALCFAPLSSPPPPRGRKRFRRSGRRVYTLPLTPSLGHEQRLTRQSLDRVGKADLLRGTTQSLSCTLQETKSTLLPPTSTSPPAIASRTRGPAPPLQQHKQRKALAESVIHSSSRFFVLWFKSPKTQLGQVAVGVLQRGHQMVSILLTMSSYHNLNILHLAVGGLQRKGDQRNGGIAQVDCKSPTS
ncbi:hypothetical protein BASA62_003412 [Batrachochytrium salamandrivorans]|nr:hypothetical protein BASA62_003412 [Batrachochytrium salamandrivorans]